MELRQLRYFVRIVELGSMGRAANDLGMGQSALSQQISRLESELSTRLFIRDARGVFPTEAGAAFFREAQLSLRHADQAARAAQQSRFTGTVSVGFVSTTATVLGFDLMNSMHARYPDVRLNLIEGNSNSLAGMLNARELDFAILFDARSLSEETPSKQRHLIIQELVEEKLFWVQSTKAVASHAVPNTDRTISLGELAQEPLILPTSANPLRNILDAAFANAGVIPNVALEVDSTAIVMRAVDAGRVSTILPWAALQPYGNTDQHFIYREISDCHARRKNLLFSKVEDELSPAALATRVVLVDCVRKLVACGHWLGTLPMH
ncbi:MAG: LysR substrate-binding domain-containing protein [Pseudomonadota bacterium]